MTDQQSRFVDEYVIDCKGSKAAIRAGYSKASANKIAWELKQDAEIAQAINERLKARQMSAEEAAKRVSDNAATRLNDYMKLKKVHELVWVRKKLSVLIAELKAEIEMEAEFHDRWTGGLGRKDLDKDDSDDTEDTYHKQQQKRKMDLLRLEIELERNPKAYRDVKELQIVEKVEVDLIGLANAHGKGAVKKLGWNEHGPTVEMYPADKALETILQMNGKLIQRHDLNNNGKSFADFLMDVNTTD